MKLILRAVTSPYDDITKGSVLSHQELDTNQINLKGELIYTANSENNVITFQKINGGTIEVPFSGGGGSGSTEITDFTYNGLNTLTITDSNGNIFTANINIFSGLTINGSLSATTISGDGSRITNILANKLWTSGSTGANSIKANNSTTTNATGTYAVANGYNTLASGYASFSKGFGTIASGDASSAEGYYTIASDDGSHAEGSNSTASGYASHAEGSNSTASGYASHAENQTNTASGNNTHAGGSGSTASGVTSFVHGEKSIAGGNSTIVLGSNITGLTANTTYVEKLNIRDVNKGTPINNLAFDANGNIIDGVQTTGFTFDNGNYNLSIFNSDGNTFTQNLGILSSDMTITGGTYNPVNGIGTFVNNSGGTFDVSGFLTGYTDTYIVSGTSNNYTGTLTLRRSDNVNITITGFTSGTSMNWYAENAAPPATRPVATGAGSVAFGNLAEALGSNMFVYGESAGNGAGDANGSNFMGYQAGQNATNANRSNFMGFWAGQNATGANNSNFLGFWAGSGATNASQSNFLGTDAGRYANGASNSNFIGQGAGYIATGASHSNFIGYHAGYQASNVSYSNLFGYNVGLKLGTPIGSNNIIIGTNISLPSGTSNAINLGGILFGTGTYSTISVIPSITGQTNGKIGIGIVTPLETLHVGGNTLIDGGLTATTIIKSGGTSSQYLMADGSVSSGTTFTGGTVTGPTNFTNNLSANTLTSSNIKITLPTITGSTGEIVYFGSDTGLTAGLIYYFNTSGQWIVANATTSTSSKYLIGIALGTSITNGILLRGYARYSVGNYSSVGVGDILYLSTTNGFFQTTAPSTSSEVVRVVGYCIDSVNDTIYFNPDNAWVEIL
jgi:hypothetical protein